MRELYSFQQQGIDDILKAKERDNRWILNFETGLGKSATSLTALRHLNAKRILIVCPAIVRMSWRREIAKWWLERTPDVGIISYGRSRKLSKKQSASREHSYTQPIQIVSYNLLREVSLENFDAIVIDEIHKIAHPTSSQSKAVRDAIRACPRAMVLGLTATLMPNHIGDVWNPLDTLWPGRFGTQKNTLKKCFKFLKRYTNMVHNGYGYQSTGVNTLHAKELEHRLTFVSSRATKAQVAHLLPPFIVTPLYFNPSELASKDAPEISGALQWHESGETSHTCIFTHRKATAFAIAERIAKKGELVFHVDGETQSDSRLSKIDSWRTHGGTFVATMHSCGIGINGLERAERVLFAELYHRPETVLQALGRFSRLSSESAASVSLLVPEGTPAEIVVEVVLNKIEAINKTIKAGDSETKLVEAMQMNDDDDDLLRSLSAIAERAEGKASVWD
jgi:superfamily II DNA or RNA helicase